jgi:phosphatidylglycerophosphate synthase
MSKLPKELDNPIDNVIYDACDKLCPYFKKLNFNPNMITTLKLVCIYYFADYMKKQKFWEAGIAYFLAYFFDCLDGFYARRYNMCTVFGDYYDHLTDIIFGIYVFYIIYTTCPEKRYMLFGILIISFTCSGIHLGCQELKYDKPVDTLKIFKSMCPDVKHLKSTRYFGLGTTITVLTLIFINFKKICKL